MKEELIQAMLNSQGRATTVESQSSNEQIMETLDSPVFFGSIENLEAIIQESDTDSNGTMKVKLPFIVGESISRAPGITKRIYWPTSMLDSVIAEGRSQILEGKQPLTVYGRHAHALDGNHLPVGSIVGFERKDRVGYVICEIEPTAEGKDIQILLQRKKLNAVSLRSSPRNFELSNVKVNGEDMFTPKRLKIDGVDFAPDNPAMPTWGAEILSQEASVEVVESINSKEASKKVDLTMETLRKEGVHLVAEIEAPFKKEVETLTQEVTSVKKRNEELTQELKKFQKAAKRASLEAAVLELASKHPKKDEILPVLQELAKDCKNKKEFSAKALPIILEAMSETSVTAESKATDVEARLRKLFTPEGKSQSVTSITQEGDEISDYAGEKVGPLEVPV